MSEEPGPRYPILVVEDVRDERAAVAELLEGAGYSTRSVQSGEAALDCAGAEPPILFVSAARAESYDRVACRLVGGDDFLAKPVMAEELLSRTSRLIRH